MGGSVYEWVGAVGRGEERGWLGGVGLGVKKWGGQFSVKMDFLYPPHRKCIPMLKKEKADVTKKQFYRKLPHQIREK